MSPDSVLSGLIVPDASKIKNYTFQASPFSASGLDSIVDMSDMYPPAGKQTPQNSCVSWAVGYAFRTYEENKKNRWWNAQIPFVYDEKKIHSPAFIYNVFRLARNPCECITGMTFQDAFDIISKFGICHISNLKYDNSRTGCCATMAPQALAEASSNKTTYLTQAILPTENNINDFKSWLSQKVPMLIGVSIDNTFTPDGNKAAERHEKYFWHPPLGSGSIAKHAMVLVGYNDDTKSFKALNSFGVGWGDKGYVEIPYDVFMEKLLIAYLVYTPGPNALVATPSHIPHPRTSIVLGGAQLEDSKWIKINTIKDYEDFDIQIASIDDTKKLVSLNLLDHENSDPFASMLLKIGSSYSFVLNRNKFTITLLDSRSNSNNSKAAARINVKKDFFEESVFIDDAFEKQIQVDKEIKIYESIKQQQQQLKLKLQKSK
jgi:hypothetical protein